MKTTSVHSLLAILIVFGGFALTAAVSRHPFDRLPHLEDEVAYLWQAKLFAGGHMSITSPEPRQSYWQPFIVDHEGRRFSKYPPGWPLLLAAGVLIGQPWVINGFLAMLIIALATRVAREVYDANTGLVAALLTATSPMMLLLNGSLMAHTAATFWGMLLTLACWRIHRRKAPRQWAAAGGIALGMVASTRPLTAVGLALPCAALSALPALQWLWRMTANRQVLIRMMRAGPLARRLLWRSILEGWPQQRWIVQTLAVFVGTAAVASLLTPLHNMAATGDPTANLYTLVWEYDRVGFGPDYGRSGHTLSEGLRSARTDVALWTSDLFGWQMPTAAHEWLKQHAGWRMGAGISWLLIPIGLIAFRQRRWTWLLAGIPAGLVGVHLFYWIGAQTYSARYYAESVPAVAILSAAGLTALARRTNQYAVYGALALLIALSLLTFTPPRLEKLHRFNGVGQDRLEALETLRDGRPVLVLVTGADRRSWRDWGTYMAVTSPYLDSDIAAAREHGWTGELETIMARFPGRQVILLPPDGVLRPADG
jgi:4-amino-4-deoxy-L-arabinose transferase-like glycosyltransferase